MFYKKSKKKMTKKILEPATSIQLAVVALEYCTNEAIKLSFTSEILEGLKTPNNCSTLPKKSWSSEEIFEKLSEVVEVNEAVAINKKNYTKQWKNDFQTYKSPSHFLQKQC